LAVVDADGYILIVDRKADFIKSWGQWVSSLDVEACALRMKDLVYIGIPRPARRRTGRMIRTKLMTASPY
jgi:acyl-coenzyme A synthetase/AMP-(fatty) acid ligase